MVLIVGELGNMGKRYKTILDFLKIENKGIDLGERIPKHWDSCIVTTPTDTHYDVVKNLEIFKRPILCEKPLSKNPNEIKKLKGDIFLVCNWKFVFPYDLYADENKCRYNFYNTGKDGIIWDLCQLIYLDEDIPIIDNDSPIFAASINGIPVSLEMIQWSYIRMLDLWANGKYDRFWNLEDALKMTEKVKLL